MRRGFPRTPSEASAFEGVVALSMTLCLLLAQTSLFFGQPPAQLASLMGSQGLHGPVDDMCDS